MHVGGVGLVLLKDLGGKFAGKGGCGDVAL